MKSVIFPLVIRTPLRMPTPVPTTTATRIDTRMGAPLAWVSPSAIAASVMVEATDRSMPAVPTTKVCPITRTIRMAAAWSMAPTFPDDRKPGSAMPNAMSRSTRAAGAASSGQEA